MGDIVDMYVPLLLLHLCAPQCLSPESAPVQPQPKLELRLALPRQLARARRTIGRTGLRERRARDVAHRGGPSLCEGRLNPVREHREPFHGVDR